MEKEKNKMKKNDSTTFNGSYNVNQMNDPIEYCPFCGKKIDVDDETKYCKFCGRAIPRTYTGSSYIIHWNLPNGTITYPKDYGNNYEVTC